MARDSRAFRMVRYIVLLLASAFVVIPVIPLLFMSFKTGVELKTTSPFALPKSFLNFYNYNYALQVGNLGRSLVTTLIIMVISLTISISLTCMVAYVLQRFSFRGKTIVYALFTMTMFIPVVTTQVVVFRMMYSLGLVNHIASVVLLYSGVGIVDIYIVVNLLNSIPTELDEAGLIDGAGAFRTYFSIILPLLKPAIVTMAVIKGIGIYNDFYVPNLYLISGPKTLTVALYGFFKGLSVPYEVVSAAVLVATIPVIVLFLFLQKYIYNGLGGAVKS